ncbi:hypothetical protein VTI74DRAFT_2073 [Chaetomium olivicolor]
MIEKDVISVAPVVTEKPYHSKRPHRKSRAGCRNCKARKVKCDESRPSCRTCTARKETCVYLPVTRRASPSSTTAATTTTTTSKDLVSSTAPSSPIHPQPLFIPASQDPLSMRLLWFYTTATYASFSTGGLRQRNVDVVLKVNVVQHAFANPFLMNCLLGLAAMHANHLGVTTLGVSPQQEIHYRARAFETYRLAVERADPATFPALLASSLLLCGLSTHVFRGDEAQPLGILDWMVLWKGIGTIVEVTKLPQLFRSGIAQLLFRPDVDLDASARCLPGYLLFMVASIKDGDEDAALVQVYYKALQFLGSLYLELGNGFSQLLLLRVATFLTFLPKEFIDAAREKRPPALVILAHYLVFVRFRTKSCWWMDGIGDHEILNIARFLGKQWEHLMRVPMASLLMTDDRDIARLLLDDPTWDKPTRMDDEPITSKCERELAVRAAMEEVQGLDAETEAYQKQKLQFGLC